jgi:hypothetical protein
MILAVGPDTPASLLMGSSAPSLSSSSASSSEDDSAADHREDQEDEASMEDEEEATSGTARPPAEARRSRWVRRTNENDGQDMEVGKDSDDDDGGGGGDDEEDDEDEDENRDMTENALLAYYNSDEASQSDEDDNNNLLGNNTSAPKPVPSMRHGGCINTASWMDCGWNISTAGVSREAVSMEECPTQLVTSGDDLLVKFWDVSQSMGTTSPLSGAYSTVCPFSAPDCSRDVGPIRNKWLRYYSTTQSSALSGSVLPLATLSTGHMNNIFHVTPLKGQPGKVATCGADGFLRLADLETGDSRVVVSPEHEDDMGLLMMSVRPAMCFSHHFLSRNTGLLCTERGLRRFDIRLPPREQSTSNLLGGSLRGCKSCAILSDSKSNTSLLEGGDSAYIFGKQRIKRKCKALDFEWSFTFYSRFFFH